MSSFNIYVVATISYFLLTILSCISLSLTFFIILRLLQVVDGHYLVRYNDTVHRHGLITSTLGLEMTVDARHFNNGAMRVKCLASISPVLWKGGKESVLQRRPGIIDNREAMLLGKCHIKYFLMDFFLFFFIICHHIFCLSIFVIFSTVRRFFKESLSIIWQQE